MSHYVGLRHVMYALKLVAGIAGVFGLTCPFHLIMITIMVFILDGQSCYGIAACGACLWLTYAAPGCILGDGHTNDN